MNKYRYLFFTAFLSFFIFCCQTNDKTGTPVSSNQKNDTATIIFLGRKLFYDTRLSANQTRSCATCHNPRFAFTDGYRTNTGAYGDPVLHNTPSLVNVSFLHYLDWAKPPVTSLALQLKRPLYNAHPVELGLNVYLRRNIAQLENDTNYFSLFKRAFADGLVNEVNIEAALVAFVTTLNSFNSPYDRFVNGDKKYLSPAAIEGLALFSSERTGCTGCHPPPLFTLNVKNTIPPAGDIFINTALYNVLNKGDYPKGDQGIFESTGNAGDKGKFKIPSLRNAALTAPYFHDGSAATLREVIDAYARGGRNITTGPWQGDGKNNPYKDKRIRGFPASEKEKRSLLAFLYSLTDSSVLANPLFTAPSNN